MRKGLDFTKSSLTQSHFSGTRIFSKMASAEAALRPRSAFMVVSDNPWVGPLHAKFGCSQPKTEQVTERPQIFC